MNKAIINLLDSNKEDNIKLAALLIPKSAYKEEQQFHGNWLYKLSSKKKYTVGDGKARKTIRICNEEKEGGYEWRIYGYEFDGEVDNNWESFDGWDH